MVWELMQSYLKAMKYTEPYMKVRPRAAAILTIRKGEERDERKQKYAKTSKG